MPYTIRDFLEIKTAIAHGFSPDASKVLVQSNLTGTFQLYRLPAAGGDLTTITDRDEPVTGGYMPASDEVLVQMDEAGNERHQIYIVDDDGGPLRRVVHDPEFRHQAGGVSRDGTTLLYTSNRRNGIDFDVYLRDLASGEERRIFDPGGWCVGGGFSPDGRYAAVLLPTHRPADNDLYLVDLPTGEVTHVSPHADESAFGPPRWIADGSAFYFRTDHAREFSCIARYEIASRQWKPVIERDRDLACAVDREGTRLLVTASEDGYTRMELFDAGTLAPLGEVPLPARGVAAGSLAADGSAVAYTFASPREPGDAWLYDVAGGTTRRLTRSPNPIPSEELVEPELHRFSSFDGEQIPVFLYLPRDRSRGPFPVVVSIHGGPEGQTIPAFNPLIQYFLYRGYAVAAPNVRGSTGYGKRFQHLDDVRRRLDSVRDLGSLHGWLSGLPSVDARKAVLAGGSYGGYMTLAGLAFQPHLWAAGISIVGISSIVTFLENTAAYRRKVREREYGSLENDREFLERASPLSHVNDMRAPLFLIHGRNDPRVPLGEAEQIHAALTAKGIPSTLLVYPDEGHGLGKLKNRLDAYPQAADFLDRVLANGDGR